MSEKEVMELLDDVTKKLTTAVPVLRNAMGSYQQLNYEQRKKCEPSFKRLGDAVAALVKASGAGWWKKWGHIVIGWICGGFIGLCLVLGLFKILFEH